MRAKRSQIDTNGLIIRSLKMGQGQTCGLTRKTKQNKKPSSFRPLEDHHGAGSGVWPASIRWEGRVWVTWRWTSPPLRADPGLWHPPSPPVCARALPAPCLASSPCISFGLFHLAPAILPSSAGQPPVGLPLSHTPGWSRELIS